VLETNRSSEDLAFLSAHDDDPFAAYEAMQQLMLETLVKGSSGENVSHAAVADAVRLTLTDEALDAAFVAEAVLPPTEAFIGDHMPMVDPMPSIGAGGAACEPRPGARPALALGLFANAANRYEYSPSAKGARRLRTVALAYLMASGAEDAPAMAMRQFAEATT
jgi:aminopeptidase N